MTGSLRFIPAAARALVGVTKTLLPELTRCRLATVSVLPAVLVSLTLGGLGFTTPTLGAERLTLDLEQMEVLKSDGVQKIDLAQIVLRQHGKMDIGQFHLKQVLVTAKGRQNDARVWLEVGGSRRIERR